ncbi:Fic family protein [Massilia arenae]|uniref:Fic family protein n=1 Tax=Massilia arenae TaxID=2603288 RepID=A0A5C7G0R6_9BURK|nr:Fic family protein [Massilia arenae]TXG01160.1 Fic family protein [Massilia arenae]
MDTSNRPVGYTWLRQQFKISTSPISHESYIGGRASSVATEHGVLQEVFVPSYWPGDDPFEHIVFALKYDHLHLDMLRQVFAKLGPEQVLDYVEKQPNGKYTRQIGYLYEFLSDTTLPLSVTMGGTYVELLSSDNYLVSAHPQRDSRWRVTDNLLGSRHFAPVVRRNAEINSLLIKDFTEALQSFKQQVEPVLFQRAVDYLYFKETRSSYDIERETPSPDREQRFVAALRNAGNDTLTQVLSETSLTQLQNLIVEPRYAQQGFRRHQNYVGESPPGRPTIVHYVCPPGELVESLMTGLLDCAKRTDGLNPIVRAALIAFGFVFVHPFEDGNGRIHRFLIHDFLTRGGLVPEGMILPVSAYMLHHPREYERALEAFSKPLRRVVRFQLDDDEMLTIVNPDEAGGYYRYPDLTTQAGYLLYAVQETITTELASEILFIRNYDQAREAIREVIDMPDRRLDKLIKLLHQNRGALSKSKRHLYQELDDAELNRIELAYQSAFAQQTLSLDGDALPGQP